MCTLILATHEFDDSTTFLASNRDEQLDRPAVGPRLWNDRDTAFVAPRDEQEGGTWLGVNEHGVLVAITNRFGEPRKADRRSRGELVIDALAEPSAEAAADHIERLDARHFNPFHLLFADRDGARIVWSDGSVLRRVELEPGVHVVTERSFGAAENGRAEFLERRVGELREQAALDRDSLTNLLKIRRVDDLDSTCVLVPEMNYGTRSSALIDLDRRKLLYSDGAPCETDYRDHSLLLDDLAP